MNTITIELSEDAPESLRKAEDGSEVEVECCIYGKVVKNDGKSMEIEVNEVEVEGEAGGESEKPGKESVGIPAGAAVCIIIGKK